MSDKETVSKEEVDEVPLDESVKGDEEKTSSKPVDAVIEETTIEQEVTIVPKVELVDKSDSDAKKDTESSDEAKPEATSKTATDNAAEPEEDRPPLPVRKSTNEVPKMKEANPILGQLREAFPSVEERYVKAVLIASQGALDPAFNALLFLSDPSFEAEAAVPVVQPTPNVDSHRSLTQVEQDELLARKLDEQFNKARHGGRHQIDNERVARERRIQKRQKAYERRTAEKGAPPPGNDRYYEDFEDEDDFLSQFVDKDLPELREKVGRQVQETSKRVNDWISGFKKTWSQEQQPDENEPVRPAGRTARFNSFGAQIGEDSVESANKLASHGISLHDYESGDSDGGDEDIPPQLPTRSREKEVVPETTYIDTPDVATRKKWQPLPPEPVNVSPSKAPSAVGSKKQTKKNPDEDEFLINSDDEM